MHVVEIGNRPASLDEIQGQYMGLLKFSPAGWQSVTTAIESIPPHERDPLHMTGLLQRMIAMGTTVHGVAVSEPWFECDSADDVRLCELALADGRLRL